MRWILTRYKILWRNAAALRISFGLQVFGMLITNSFWLIAVLLFASKMPYTSWTVYDVLALQGISAFSYGCAFLLFDGVNGLREMISSGRTDALLVRPRHFLLLILTSHVSAAGLTDIFYGAALIAISFTQQSPDATSALLFLSSSIPITLILISTALAVSTLAFYFPHERQLRFLYRLIMNPGFYPLDSFMPPLKVIFTLVFPALLIGAWPAEALRVGRMDYILVVWAGAVMWAAISLLFLRFGVRRYESGNGIG